MTESPAGSAGSELEARIQRLEDIEAIKRLKARYFRAVDDKDVETFRGVFADDATFEALGVVRRGRDEIVGLSSLVQPGIKTVHHGHMPEIDILSPDRATGTWAMLDDAYLPQVGDIQPRAQGYGHYREEYVKTEGRWYISKSELTRLRIEHWDAPSHDGAGTVGAKP